MLSEFLKKVQIVIYLMELLVVLDTVLNGQSSGFLGAMKSEFSYSFYCISN